MSKFEETLKKLTEIISLAIKDAEDISQEIPVIKSINALLNRAEDSSFYDTAPIRQNYTDIMKTNVAFKAALESLFDTLENINMKKEAMTLSPKELECLKGLNEIVNSYFKTGVPPIVLTKTAEEMTQEEKTEADKIVSKSKLTPTYVTWIDDLPKYKYYVTKDGKVHQIQKGEDTYLRPRQIYKHLVINLIQKKSHRLDKIVWEAFNPEFRNAPKYELGYRDGDFMNCSLDNLYLKSGKPLEII